MTSVAERQQVVDWIDEARNQKARLAPACDVAGITARTYQRWQQAGNVQADQRPTAQRPVPQNKYTPEEREAMVTLCNQPEYSSRPPAYIVADQLDNGCYPGSESTLYRVLHESGQASRRGRQQHPKRQRGATTHHATAANQLWSWDITWLPGPARGSWFYLYLILDVFSRKIVGWEVYDRESGELACDVVEKACWREKLTHDKKPLVLHSDNGSPMKAATFLEKLYDLGITPSRSRPRVSNDNAYSESLFKTLKYRPSFPVNGFSSLTEAREWVLAFVRWYNTEHRHSALKYVTPEQRHNGEAKAILIKRKQALEAAKAANPTRWSGGTQNLSLPETVTLNPEKAVNY